MWARIKNKLIYFVFLFCTGCSTLINQPVQTSLPHFAFPDVKNQNLSCFIIYWKDVQSFPQASLPKSPALVSSQTIIPPELYVSILKEILTQYPESIHTITDVRKNTGTVFREFYFYSTNASIQDLEKVISAFSDYLNKSIQR